MPPEPKVQVIIDPTDSPVLDAELARRADPPRGVVVVRPVPGVAKPADLAADVLIGLGKRFDALTREKKQSDGWRLAQMWLQAEDTRHVVIVDADRLPTPLWSALRSLARSLQSRLWLIGSAPPSPDQAHALGRHASVGLAEFLEALPGAPTSTPEEQGVEGPIPDDNFLTFRASCWDLLPAERFRAVDRIYRDTHWDTRHAACKLRLPLLQDGKAIVEHLRELVATSSGPAETLIRFRAAQAAFFARGILVNLVPITPGMHAVPPPDLRKQQEPMFRLRANLAGLVPLPPGSEVVHSLGLTRTVASRLRRLVTPQLVAAFAIAAAHRDVDPSHLLIESVTARGNTITVGAKKLPIPDYGRALIAVHRLDRLHSGAQPGDPLFVNNRGTAAKTALVRTRIDKAGELAGVVDAHDALTPQWSTAGVGGWAVVVSDAWPEPPTFHDLCHDVAPR
ncbi:MAG: hypothetical protein QOK39_263 [Acidimicrobiaceae bacterium]|nr:hypothetical protein [Acidimicrobiaceae bacterium]